MVDSSKISDREELIHFLSEASELEHGLCCCYLFAAFSLKRTADEGLTESEQLALAPVGTRDQWRRGARDAPFGSGEQPAHLPGALRHISGDRTSRSVRSTIRLRSN